MATSHHCTARAYNVSFIIGTYLNVCTEALTAAYISDLGGRISVSFQYLREKISHGWDVGRPLLPFLKTLFLTRD